MYHGVFRVKQVFVAAISYWPTAVQATCSQLAETGRVKMVAALPNHHTVPAQLSLNAMREP